MECPIKVLTHQIIRIAQTHKTMVENRLLGEKVGIFPAQHRMLMVLAKEPYMSQREIAEILQVSPATITISIKKLEKQGYLIRESQEEDNRYNMVTITQKGKDVIEQSKGIFDEIGTRMFKGFSNDELEGLGCLLERIKNNLN